MSIEIQKAKALAKARARKARDAAATEASDPNAMLASQAAGMSPYPSDGPKTAADMMYNSPIYQFMRENAEIPMGMGGAIAGGVAGAPFGPAGVIAGTIIGGAAGSGGGSLLSDAALGEELNFAKAVEEAAWSAGIDVALLGLGKIAKPMWRAWRTAGKTPEDVVADLARQAGQAPKSGSAGSIAQTQHTLSEAGATLTPFQTSQANAWSKLKEQAARIGIWSSGDFQRNAAKVNEIAQQEFNRIMSGGHALSPEELGEAVFSTIMIGKKSLGETYEQATKLVREGLKESQRIPTNRLIAEFDRFLASYQKEVGSHLNKETIAVVREFQKTLDELPVGGIKASELLDLEKMLRDRITEMSDFSNPAAVQKASAQLAELSSRVREAIGSEINRIDPKLGSLYSEAKSAYSAGMSELMPELTKSMLTQGGKENFDVLGKALIDVTNVSKAKGIMNSINRAYSAAKQAGFDDLPFPTVREAKKAIRVSYLEQLFKGADETTFDMEMFKGLASRFDSPKEAAKLQAVLGEAYGPTKRLLNLMADATKHPESNLGQLFLRSKEYQSLTSAGSTMASGVVGGMVGTSVAGGSISGGLLGVAAFLGVPKLWAKVATDPKTANRLLAYNSAKFPTAEAATIAFTNLMADLANQDNDYRELIKEHGSEMLINATERKEQE